MAQQTRATPRRALGLAFTISAATGLGCSVDDGILGRIHTTDAAIVVDTSIVADVADVAEVTNVAESAFMDLGALEGVDSVPPRDGDVDAGGTANCELYPPSLRLAGRGTAQPYDVCLAGLADTFLNALCTCGDATFGGQLQTRGFDSRGLDAQSNGSGAPVGVNGRFSMRMGAADVGGSLTVAGPEPLELKGTLRVSGDLRSGGDVTVSGIAEVARNAWFAGDFLGIGELTVGGDLHHAGSLVALSLSYRSNVREPVAIKSVCSCSEAEVVPIRALVGSAWSATREDGEADLSMLETVTGETLVRIPCGKHRVRSISGRGHVVIATEGTAAVFVGSAVELDGDLELRPGVSGQIDLFVAGDFNLHGGSLVGSKSRPSATRVYVAGNQGIALRGPLYGNLYAPYAAVHTSETEIWGSLFAKELTSTGGLSVNFDRAVLTASTSCTTPPPSSCQACGWCTAGMACVGGACGPCREDNDCCSQAVCQAGRCSPLTVLR